MAMNFPFRPMGNSISLNTSGTVSTSQSVPITLNDIYGGPYGPLPSQCRIINLGTAAVFVSFTPATATIAIPTAGTTTTGTPTFGFFLIPNVVEVFSIGVGTANTNSSGYAGLYFNNISATATQNIVLQFGEGQ